MYTFDSGAAGDCVLITIVDDLLFSESRGYAIAERTISALREIYGEVTSEREPTSFAGYRVSRDWQRCAITLSMPQTIEAMVDEHYPHFREGRPEAVLRAERTTPAAVDAPRALHVLTAGVCIRKSKILTRGDVWGLDFLLPGRVSHKYRVTGRRLISVAITYVETLLLSQRALNAILLDFPEELKRIRGASRWQLVRMGLEMWAAQGRERTRTVVAKRPRYLWHLASVNSTLK